MKKIRLNSDCPVCQKGQMINEFSGMLKKEYTEINRCNVCNHREILIPELV